MICITCDRLRHEELRQPNQFKHLSNHQSAAAPVICLSCRREIRQLTQWCYGEQGIISQQESEMFTGDMRSDNYIIRFRCLFESTWLYILGYLVTFSLWFQGLLTLFTDCQTLLCNVNEYGSKKVDTYK